MASIAICGSLAEAQHLVLALTLSSELRVLCGLQPTPRLILLAEPLRDRLVLVMNEPGLRTRRRDVGLEFVSHSPLPSVEPQPLEAPHLEQPAAGTP